MNVGDWDLGQWLIIGFSAFLIIWYVIVAYMNRQRGLRIYRWIRDGLTIFGSITDVQWIGSSGSGAKIVINNADNPFERVEVIYLLESREILPLWLINMARDKRDEMIFKASLRRNPSQEIEVAREGDKQFSKILVHDNKPPFTLISAPEGFQIACRGKENQINFQNLREYLLEEGETTRSLSLRKERPHLVLRISLPKSIKTPAGDFFSSLNNLLNQVE